MMRACFDCFQRRPDDYKMCEFNEEKEKIDRLQSRLDNIVLDERYKLLLLGQRSQLARESGNKNDACEDDAFKFKVAKQRVQKLSAIKRKLYVHMKTMEDSAIVADVANTLKTSTHLMNSTIGEINVDDIVAEFLNIESEIAESLDSLAFEDNVEEDEVNEAQNESTQEVVLPSVEPVIIRVAESQHNIKENAQVAL